MMVRELTSGYPAGRSHHALPAAHQIPFDLAMHRERRGISSGAICTRARGPSAKDGARGSNVEANAPAREPPALDHGESIDGQTWRPPTECGNEARMRGGIGGQASRGSAGKARGFRLRQARVAQRPRGGSQIPAGGDRPLPLSCNRQLSPYAMARNRVFAGASGQKLGLCKSNSGFGGSRPSRIVEFAGCTTSTRATIVCERERLGERLGAKAGCPRSPPAHPIHREALSLCEQIPRIPPRRCRRWTSGACAESAREGLSVFRLTNPTNNVRHKSQNFSQPSRSWP